MHNNLILNIIVPCYNEHEVLAETARQLLDKLQNLVQNNKISEESKIVFIDDGSLDNTWDLIEKLYDENPKKFAGLKLSKNRGHQNALLCGLLSVKDTADITISIDADLQDDIDVIDKMISHYNDGCEIVYGVRSSRKRDTLFKKSSAQGFYRFMSFLGIDIVYNHADFRLMGKKALNALAEFNEVNIFLRGIIPMLGFKTASVYYKRKSRFAGENKYPMKNMFKFAFEGISSFSIKPIRFISILGLLIFIISLGMVVYSIVQHVNNNTVSGWSSIICSIWGIGGLVLLSIGIVGEYIGKIYLETKHRPRFTIEKIRSTDKLII